MYILEEIINVVAFFLAAFIMMPFVLIFTTFLVIILFVFISYAITYSIYDNLKIIFKKKGLK